MALFAVPAVTFTARIVLRAQDVRPLRLSPPPGASGPRLGVDTCLVSRLPAMADRHIEYELERASRLPWAMRRSGRS